MNKLKQLVERDQWSELLVDARSVHKQSKNSEIEVLAFSEQEAIKKASNIFDVLPQHLSFIKTVSSSTILFGFVKKPAHYLFSVQDAFKDDVKSQDEYIQHNEMANHKNGSFSLQMRKDGLKLRVFEPKGLGKPVIISDITSALAERGIVKFDMKLIQNAIHNPGSSVSMKPYSDREKENNSVFHIEVAKDAMTATMTFTKPLGNGRLPEVEEVIESLHQNRVKYGINKQYITEAIENELYNVPLIVAEGKEVINGSDEDIEYHFPTGEISFKHAVRPDGSVDFKELNVIHNVHKDEVIATIHAAVKGQQGMTVLGGVILPTEGTSAAWELGTNVYMSDDRSQVKASSAGQVYIKNGQLCVDPALEIESDVDLSTGNIDFLGNVVIKGNITDGFNVTAGGNIEIHGHVGKCFIYSDGNVVARQGIQGKDAGHIECKGDLFVRFVERANLRVGGNLVVTKSLLHSKVVCDQGVYVVGDKKSIIAGGSIQAELEIVANQLGAESYIETYLEVGYSDKVLSEIRTIASVLTTLEEKNNELKQEKMIIVQSSTVDAVKDIDKKIATLAAQKLKNENMLKDKKQILEKLYLASSISAIQTIMPGIKIKIGTAVIDVKAKQGSGTMVKNKNQINFNPYVQSEFLKKSSQDTPSNKNSRIK